MIVPGLLAAGYYGEFFQAECANLRKEKGKFSPKVLELETIGKDIQ